MAANDIFCTDFLKRTPGFLADSLLSLVDGISAEFHSQVLGGFLFLFWCSRLGRLCGVEPFAPESGPLYVKYLSRFSTAARVGPALFVP